jgi:hypothetical protein
MRFPETCSDPGRRPWNPFTANDAFGEIVRDVAPTMSRLWLVNGFVRGKRQIGWLGRVFSSNC